MAHFIHGIEIEKRAIEERKPCTLTSVISNFRARYIFCIVYVAQTISIIKLESKMSNNRPEKRNYMKNTNRKQHHIDEIAKVIHM